MVVEKTKVKHSDDLKKTVVKVKISLNENESEVDLLNYINAYEPKDKENDPK